MLESPTSRRRVDFDDAVTVEELRRTHPLRSSFLHGESIKKTSRSSTRSSNGIVTIRRSSSSKSTPPGKCPVHGKKTSATGSIPDVIVPVPISRQNSSDGSIGIQPVYAAPLKSALKNPTGAVLQKPQGWAGLQWALLMGCYALMLLLAVVVGVVLIQQHRKSTSADDRSGAFPDQLNIGATNDFQNRPRRGPGFSNNNNNQNFISSNQAKGTKLDAGGPPSRDIHGKSLTSQEALGNSLSSQGSSRNPKVNQAGIPIFSNQPSSQPSPIGSQSGQAHGNQRLNPSFSNSQNRGSSVSQSPFPGQQTNQQNFAQQNLNNRGSSPPRSPIRPSPIPLDQSQGSSFLSSPHQNSNHPSSNNQQRSQPSHDQTQSSSFPSSQQNPNQASSNNQQRNQHSLSRQNPNQPLSNNQQRNQPSLSRQNPNQPLSNNQQRNQPSLSRQNLNQALPNNQQRNQPSLPRQNLNQPLSNNQQRNQPSLSRQNLNQPSSTNQQRNQPSLSRQNPNQLSSNNQQRNQPSLSRQNLNQPSSNNQGTHPRQRTNQPQQPGQNRRNPSSNQQQPRRPSHSNIQASQLPFNNDPAVQPRFPFEQRHRPASLDRSNTPLPTLDKDFTLSGNSRIPGTDDPDVKIAQLWNHQNSDGSFTYGYVNTDGSFKNETRGIGGCVEGIYGYIDPVSNQEVRVPYKTGNTASNCNIPQPPWPPQAG